MPVLWARTLEFKDIEIELGTRFHLRLELGPLRGVV